MEIKLQFVQETDNPEHIEYLETVNKMLNEQLDGNQKALQDAIDNIYHFGQTSIFIFWDGEQGKINITVDSVLPY